MDGLRRAIALTSLAAMMNAQAPLPLFAQGPFAPPPLEPREIAPASAPSVLPAALAAAPAAAFVSARSELLIEPAIGGTVRLDGVSVELPPGALEERARISIQRLGAIETLGEGLANVTVGALAYRFEPHGTIFAKPVTIRVPFDRRLLASEAALSNLFTYFYDEEQGRWERLRRVGIDREGAAIASVSTHFSDMIDATLGLPEAPPPIRFDPNSIKSLEAADPAVDLPLPEGPQADALGSNTFALPLRLPPGRGGATPRLELRYSSEGLNGWLGRGFDIEVPAVTIDTRFGMPSYLGEDRYSLEGEELLPIGREGPETGLYEPRVEKSYRRVRWLRTATEDYWETTDKDGTVREYGRGEGWLGPDRGDRRKTFAWYLTKEADSFGNTIRYFYSYDGPNSHAYLARINYSGHEKGGRVEAGRFDISFVLESEDREDRRIDARGGFVSRIARRLARIDVDGERGPIRSYVFGYATNEFGQSQLSSYGERDASGKAFYDYAFEYFQLPRRTDGAGEVLGYDAFGEGEKTWSLDGGESYGGLQSSTSSTLGANFSLSLQAWIWIPFWGRESFASISASAGCSETMSATQGTLLDVNSDGLLDIAWKEGGSLRWYPNTGSGFDASSPRALGGLSSALDKEAQVTYDLGLSASVAVARGGVTWQESWTHGSSSFADIDGDGRVDFLTKGSASYALNTGSAFEPMPWGLPGTLQPDGAASVKAASDDYDRGYYVEEPVRAWEAGRPGTVEVRQDGKLLDESRIGQVLLLTHEADGGEAGISLSGAASSGGSTASYALDSGERLFFHLGTNRSELKADVDWRVRVEYKTIRLFDSLTKGAIYSPPATLSADRYSDELRDIYSSNRQGGYTLAGNWEAEAKASTYDALVRGGLFVARRIPKSLFDRILDSASSLRSRRLSYYLADSDPPRLVADSASERDTLRLGYGYDPQTETFLRVGWPIDAAGRREYADEAFMRVAATLGEEEKRELALCRLYDSGELLRPSPSGAAYAYSRSASTSLRPILADAASSATDGAVVFASGVLLETRYDEVGVALERLWLRPDEAGSWRLARERLANGEESAPAGARVLVDASGDISLAFSDGGVARTIRLGGRTNFPLSISASLYEGRLGEAVLKGEAFSDDSYLRIPGLAWEEIAGALESDSELRLLSDNYSLQDDGSYALATRDTIAAVDLERIVAILHARGSRSDSIFDSLPSEAASRIILLGASDYEKFLAAEGEALEADFSTLTLGAKSFHYPTIAALSSDSPRLGEAMKRYRRDAELLSSAYAEDGDAWILGDLSRVSEERRAALASMLDSRGVFAYSSLDRGIEYSSAQDLDVESTTLPEGALVESIRASRGRSDAPGSRVGALSVPTLDAKGRLVLARVFLHAYDSLADFSNVDLSTMASPDSYVPAKKEYFGGGVYGWYYGVWSGYYDWLGSGLGAYPPTAPSGSVAYPPYSLAMRENRDSQGQVAISRIEAGADRSTALSVPEGAMIGKVSSYSETTMDDDLAVSSREYRFAAFTEGDRLHPSRNGGDSYYKIPRGSEDSGKELGDIRSSHSAGTDRNGGISFGGLGGSVSDNHNECWQYRALLDMNGDRYPDIVSFEDREGGASRFVVEPGTGRGFGAGREYSLSVSAHASATTTESWGFGASVGSGKVGIGIRKKANGSTQAITIEAPDKGSGGTGANMGFNGTFGTTIQREGFFDMNGDGLPDFVSRSGSGEYAVSLNEGDGGFASPVSWGSGIDDEFAFSLGLGGVGDIAIQGITHTATGSFGLTTGATIDGGFAALGVNAGFNGTVSKTVSTLADVNGDGLPDLAAKLKDDGYFLVRFNLGDRFSGESVRLYRPDWTNLSGYTSNLDTDVDSLSGGLDGATLSGSSLPLPARAGSVSGYASGKDNQFRGEIDPTRIDDTLEFSTGASFNLGASGSLTFYWPLLCMTLTAGLHGAVATTTSDLKFVDIDGDGLPDHALRLPGERRVRVKLNQLGKVGLLKTLRLPMGGSYAFEYARSGNTVEMPQSRWVLSSLAKDDGASGLSTDRGEHSYRESYDYAKGYYDRGERLFYGFASVSVTKADGSVRATRYLNEDYYTRGMSSGGELVGPGSSGAIDLCQERIVAVSSALVRRVYRSNGVAVDIKAPRVVEERSRQYQRGSGNYVETRKSYVYEDDYGNVTEIHDYGTRGEPGQELHAVIDYDFSIPGSDYLKQHPVSIKVTDGSDKTLRWRTGHYGASGELLDLEEYFELDGFRRQDLGYDAEGYGNLASVTDPRGYRVSWEYDAATHSYPTRIRRGNAIMSSPTYDSSATWDTSYGKKTSETDENGQRMSYAYDSFGRLVEARSPYDDAVGLAAVGFDYCPPSSFPWTATTTNKLLHDRNDGQVMRTIAWTDGLGRALQTAKEGEYRDGVGTRRFGWNLSGAVAYDGQGRPIGEGQPRFAEGRGTPGLAAMWKPTLTSYDAQDRIVERSLPDGARTTTAYLVGGNRVLERSVDPLGNASEVELDGRGNVMALRRLSASSIVLMSASYAYDALGELVAAVDSRGNSVSLSYDLSGRRTSLESADAGRLLFDYDAAGNLAKKTDSVLRGRGEAIAYRYDGLERLVEVLYPKSAPTTYVYGDAFADKGGVGRLVRLVDASGSATYEYGLLGELLATSRTIDRLTPLADDLSARFEYLSDYLGRLQRITYPDGEVLSYGYDSGGRVKTVSSAHNGLITDYVLDVAYDAFDQRSYIEYGNGLRTSYAYDGDRRWLSSIRTLSGSGTVHQDIEYRFDLVGNILGYANGASGYETKQSYAYDDLYQLTKAEGASVYRPYGMPQYSSQYEQAFAYDSIGNMTSKRSSSGTSPDRRVGDNLNYDHAYGYYPGKAHQAERIGELYYRYDSNGNLIEERSGGHGTSEVLAGTVYSSGDLRMTDTGFGLARTTAPGSGLGGQSVYSRSYAWDEENRLIRSVDDSIAVDYRYGADGQRAAKYSRNGESLYFDGMWSCQTDYPALRQMKNIYVGQTRVATRINFAGENTTGYESQNTYYYHGDHLGSAQLVTDSSGAEYERIEYTPYGESWIEKDYETQTDLPYKFTGKELDSETGLYYYGARYMNPRTSNWLSVDPALGDYIPAAPIDDEARRYNANLPGMGGVFNLVNLALYNYAGNNPVRYTDPDGRIFAHYTNSYLQNDERWRTDPYGKQPNETLGNSGCNLTAAVNNANALTGSDITPQEANTATYVDAAGNFDYAAFASDKGLGYARHDVGPKSIEGLLRYYDQAKTTFAVSARVPYMAGNNKDTHVVNIVGIMKDANGEMWAKLDPTSLGDKNLTARKRDDWKFEMVGGTVVNAYVKASSITSLQSDWKE